MKLSPHAQIRLERFNDLLSDKDYDLKKAIRGLEGWQFSQSYRLTSDDNIMISQRIKEVKSFFNLK